MTDMGLRIKCVVGEELGAMATCGDATVEWANGYGSRSLADSAGRMGRRSNGSMAGEGCKRRERWPEVLGDYQRRCGDSQKRCMMQMHAAGDRHESACGACGWWRQAVSFPVPDMELATSTFTPQLPHSRHLPTPPSSRLLI